MKLLSLESTWHIRHITNESRTLNNQNQKFLEQAPSSAQQSIWNSPPWFEKCGHELSHQMPLEYVEKKWKLRYRVIYTTSCYILSWPDCYIRSSFVSNRPLSKVFLSTQYSISQHFQTRKLAIILFYHNEHVTSAKSIFCIKKPVQQWTGKIKFAHRTA